MTSKDMDDLENVEMTKSRQPLKNSFYIWFDWLTKINILTYLCGTLK